MTGNEKLRLRPWLETKINSENVPGLRWCNKEKKEFRVAWKHAGKPDFIVEKDAMLFKLWAEHTGKYRQGESADPSTWKTRFRCALHKMPDVEEVKVPHSLDEKEPYRVFRFKDKAEGSTNRNLSSPRSEEPRNGKRFPSRQKPVDSAYEQSSVIRSAPPSREIVFFNNNFSATETSIGRQHESSYHENSDSSLEDDLDNITPTLPAPYGMEPMLTDDPSCGTAYSPYLYPHSNSHGFNFDDRLTSSYMRNFTSGLDSVDPSVKRDLIGAVMAASGHGSFYGDPAFGHAILQQMIAANSTMKFVQGMSSQDECSMGSTAASTHLNMDNGLIEPSCMEMEENVGRMVTIPYSGNTPASSLSKATNDGWDCAMHIRTFYDHSEVFSTETTFTENERIIRIFHGSPVGPGQVKMELYSKLFGPPGAKQVELPEVSNCCKETSQVLTNLKRGFVLEMNEERDIFVVRLCLSKVFYCNGRKAAKKLNREERVKVFDYKGKFLPILKESRNGNCACPSDDVTFYLGRANGSLVSIVVTHVLAKVNLHQMNSAGEKFLSEPNQNDQLATRLEQDCMY